MSHRVHVLATCLDPSRYGAVSLVFSTIRKGFPTADIFVYGNGMNPEMAWATKYLVEQSGGKFINIPTVPHGEWITGLIENEHGPFWICDTDIVFFDKVEDWFVGSENEVLFAGRYEPEFWEDWTNTIHSARLHPSLMWFNPQMLRAELRRWPMGCEFLGTVNTEPFRWHYVPMFKDGKREVHFMDTCSGIYHMLGGTPFQDHQNDCYEHLYCGSYIHLMDRKDNLIEVHNQAFRDPQSIKGLKKIQDEWYAANVVKRTPPVAGSGSRLECSAQVTAAPR